MNGAAPFEGPLDIDLRFLISKPKTKPKYKRFPDVKPDIDNFVKACFDAMAKIVFRDDAQVCRLSVQKEYSQTVGTEVRVVPLRENR
jgi:Holliday junction resolvase RusA-like endonuclease